MSFFENTRKPVGLGGKPFSYTHLDVYKRQLLHRMQPPARVIQIFVALPFGAP